MSAPTPPRRPDDALHDVALAELLARHHAHVNALLVGRLRLADPATAAAVFDHAIAALALSHAVADRLLAGRWSTVRDALSADASRGAEVAAACGLDLDEVAVGLRVWADGQHRHGLMNDLDRDVVALLARCVEAER